MQQTLPIFTGLGGYASDDERRNYIRGHSPHVRVCEYPQYWPSNC